jgi:hypothetical protein
VYGCLKKTKNKNQVKGKVKAKTITKQQVEKLFKMLAVISNKVRPEI